MPKYQTKQRKTLLEYLARHADETLSGKQIADALQDDNISLSAVYRNLAELEEEGKVHRISKEGSRKVYFRYEDADCKSHLHLSCRKCGKTYHLDAAETDCLISSVAQSSRFAVDTSDTVLYGVCADCQYRLNGEKK